MRYAKLINSQIHYAPNPIKVGDRVIGNPPDSVYIEAGYFPAIETDPPGTDAQHYAEPYWQEEPNRIMQRWEVKEIPISDEEALTRYANSITGASDPDLISAAETLITERIKED